MEHTPEEEERIKTFFEKENKFNA